MLFCFTTVTNPAMLIRNNTINFVSVLEWVYVKIKILKTKNYRVFHNVKKHQFSQMLETVLEFEHCSEFASYINSQKAIYFIKATLHII